jgi:outer membrane protein TolC
MASWTDRLRRAAWALPAAAAVAAAPPDPLPEPRAEAMKLPPVPAGSEAGVPLPIDLPTALRLADVSPLDIAIAAERLNAAAATLDRARVMWLPNVGVGADYFRHDGQIQDIRGEVFGTSKSSFLLGYGPTFDFATADAYFAPLVGRQLVRARAAEVQAAKNDSLFAVANSYFDVQQARGEVAGALDAARRAEDLVARTQKLAPGLIPDVEINRARAELARTKENVEAAYERWQVASAELTRLLRLEPGTVVVPAEPPDLRVSLVDAAANPADLFPVGLANRPEVAAHAAAVQAAQARTRQEQVRPFVPKVALRGLATPSGGLTSGYFGGGINDDIGKFGSRNTMDLQAVWQLENFGLGNKARVREQQAGVRGAAAELDLTRERVMAEITRAVARVRRAGNRLQQAEVGVKDAVESAEKNLAGLGQTKRVGESLILVLRPQEAVQSVVALNDAYRDYYAAVADVNRGQFELYRAVGHPASEVVKPHVIESPLVTTPAVAPAPAPPPAPPTAPAVPAGMPAWLNPPKPSQFVR